MTYLEEIFAGVECKKGKKLADLFRSAAAKIEVVKEGSLDSDDEGYDLRQNEGLLVTEALIQAGGLSGKTVEIIRYSKTSTQVEIRGVDGTLVWRDFTFTDEFVFGLAKAIAQS
ncbi:TPA: hypothetical protein SMO99_003821 [Proteus mirabilis]|uniref:Uncharacterized protein n=2 Tax=Morganellaceae TaxID=1903414 RepID=A0AAI9HW51_MORMO|nr:MULTISPECIES: hypothetical protein [Providencia]EJV1665076.1 hypothetical protein [Klebsiella pneumoniae]EKW8763268.1 hypothetical protein [Morganella morganii]HEJ9425883.1 hypothetical protein [Proteus mirabilis]ELI9034622.1 hypothetical protein [Morganella morganii]MBX6950009.1 hypothetical protein [Providencia rettgeri]